MGVIDADVTVDGGEAVTRDALRLLTCSLKDIRNDRLLLNTVSILIVHQTNKQRLVVIN